LKIRTIVFALSVLLCLSLAADTPTISPPNQSAGVYKGALNFSPDISESNEKKDSRDRIEKKLSNQLLQLTDSEYLPPDTSRSELINQMKDQEQITEAPILYNAHGVSSGLIVYVYIKLKEGNDPDILTKYVSKIENQDTDYNLVTAWVDINSLKSLAALDAVKSIQEVIPPVIYTGKFTSEGDALLKADLTRALGADGAGIKVGIISDGVDNYISAVSSGDLPSDLTVLSNKIGGDEGTAMLEIVHDLAPSAKLYFHDCGTSTIDFINSIDKLKNAGCDIICDDTGWITEPFFEDGEIAQHIEKLISTTDIIYVTAAGNAAGSHYQGIFKDFGDGTADFRNGSNSSTPYLYVKLSAGKELTAVMEWNDPFGVSGNDYDLYLFNASTGDLLDQSQFTQNGDDDPLEAIQYRNNTGADIDVVLVAYAYKAPVAKILELYVYGGFMYLNNVVSLDSIFGHAAVPGVLSCGAIRQTVPDDIESFSSRGPVTMLTETRQKPDICGIDGVSITGAGGFGSYSAGRYYFFGTSAAAPHIAALSALLKSRFPSYSASQIESLILDNHVDLGVPGYDNIFGYGRADVYSAAISAPSIRYQTHVQNIGWQGWKRNGQVSGTNGQSLRLEGIYIDIEGMDNAVEYRTHVQDIGWQTWVNEGGLSGTTGRWLRLEAIQIQLKGDMAAKYDIYYRVHAQNFGWMDWAKNGQSAGTAGLSYRLEAIQIKLVKKGGSAPGPTAVPFRDANGSVPTYVSVNYRAHVQSIGWQGWVSDGEVAGTTGQSLRLEAMYIDIERADNTIDYSTHVQNIGWQAGVNEGEMTGTTGRSLQLEAIQIRLKGDMAANYDVYYRVHTQNIGWMDWAKNGQSAGTVGLSYRLEAIQIVIVQKGAEPPGSTARPFISA